jgi:hypothetical protein
MKYLLFITLTLVSVSLFAISTPALKVKVPAKTEAGKTFLVEVTIDKQDMTCFGQYRLKMPKGFTPIEQNSVKGEFKYEQGLLAITWIALPKEAQILISFNVVTDAVMSGSFSLESEFIVQQDNQRSGAKTTNSIEVAAVNGNLPVFSSKNIAAQRSLLTVSEAESEIWVNIQLNKENLTGKATLSEKMPAGFAAFPGMTNGSTFSLRNDSLFFDWQNLPKENSFTVSYILIPMYDTPLSKISMTGTFKALIEKRYDVVAISNSMATENILKSAVTLKGKGTQALTARSGQFISILDVAGNQKSQTNHTKEVKKEEKKETGKKDKVKKEAAKKETTKKEITEKEEKSKKEGGKEEKVIYKVQIMSSTEKVKPEYFKKYKLTTKVTEEKVDGAYKYLTGSFTDFTDALQYSDKLEKETQIKGPFVVTYKNGKRVSGEKK